MHNSSRRLCGLLLGVVFMFCLNSIAFASPLSETLPATRVPSPPTEDRIVVVRNRAFTYVPESSRAVPIEIVSFPAHGELRIESDRILFIPCQDVCGMDDSFSYARGQGANRQLTNVQVEILCEELTILNGFDPGSSEIGVFTIKGVENFPENELIIFDSWGKMVFSAKNYRNDWDGTHPETGDLLSSSDAMFYYVFDDGRGSMHSGYLKIGSVL